MSTSQEESNIHTDDKISSSTRSLGEITPTIKPSLDLVSAARKTIELLRCVAECSWLHRKSTLVEAVRRYDELWMPLIFDVTVSGGGGSMPLMIVPPFDVEWVWFCHTLNPVSYKQYCESKFSKLIPKPAIFNEENEEYALMRCRDVWNRRYPSDPFESESDTSDHLGPKSTVNEELLSLVLDKQCLYSKFSEPYMTDIVYLIAARQRYMGFLYLLQRFGDDYLRFVPTSDVILMWITHQSYPTVYAGDLNGLESETVKVTGIWETANQADTEKTKKLWETTFDQPYEKAGGKSKLSIEHEKIDSLNPPFNWDVSDEDINTMYKSIMPRFLLEVCVFVKPNSKIDSTQGNLNRDFLRLRIARCHRELKFDKTISSFPLSSWQKAWHLYCEFGTRGAVLETRRNGSKCFTESSNLQDRLGFYWNDLLRASSLSLGKEIDRQMMRIETSITPPVQAPYLLKCVPDRVTDDSGAMISDVILKMNNYRPQEGRWLSRTVLDHVGRECFIIRMRVGGGFWRRGGETPLAVKWEDRIIEIREGSWSYIAGSIGRAPEKVVGTATPKEPLDQWKAAWYFSTGDELLIKWESSPSISGVIFHLKKQSSPDSSMVLLKGRKMQYQVNKTNSENKDEEEGFLTLVRFTEGNPEGRATALLNWKLLVMEFLPEEDAVFVLLLCISILRSVSEMRKEDIGNLLIRRRLKETKIGVRDWGSVTLHPSSYSASSSCHLRPWYWNANSVMAPFNGSLDHVTRQQQPGFNYSLVEGGESLYKHGIIT